jgi:V-type H+-transporting ATPase proteolipid subunit
MGASYGTAKAGVGVIATGVLRPDLIIKSSSTTLIDFPLFS